MRAVVPWLSKWSRPDGYRDFLSDRGLHVGAAWVSAVLDQPERAHAELRLAHAGAARPSEPGFDRAKTEQDLAIAAPFAAGHGLSEYLTALSTRGGDAAAGVFTSRRWSAAQMKTTTPDVDCDRLLHRLAVVAELCHRHIEG